MKTPGLPRRAAALLVPLLVAASSCGDPDAPTPAPDQPPAVDHQASEPDGSGQATPPPAAPADPRLGQALEALGAGDLESCRLLATAVLVDHPDHPRGHFLLGLGLHKAKRYAEARPHLVAADAPGVDYESREAAPYFRGWCHYYLGEYDEARAAFARHLETIDEGDSHFGLGVVALELGDEMLGQTSREQIRQGRTLRIAIYTTFRCVRAVDASARATHPHTPRGTERSRSRRWRERGSVPPARPQGASRFRRTPGRRTEAAQSSSWGLL